MTSTFDLRDIVFDTAIAKWTTFYVVELYEPLTNDWWASRYFASLTGAQRYQQTLKVPSRITEEKLWN